MTKLVKANLLAEEKVNQTDFISFLPSDQSAASELCSQGHTSFRWPVSAKWKTGFQSFQPCYHLVTFQLAEQVCFWLKMPHTVFWFFRCDFQGHGNFVEKSTPVCLYWVFTFTEVEWTAASFTSLRMIIMMKKWPHITNFFIAAPKICDRNKKRKFYSASWF